MPGAAPGIIGGVVNVGGCWPFRGTVVWLTPEQGGRASGPPAPPPGEDYASTAFVPPHTVETGLASFDRPIAPGTEVVVTEGPRVVGHFHVEQVLSE